MNKIFISDMEFFAFHGHYPQEKTSGNKFLVDLTMYGATQKAELSDDLKDAINYQIAYALIRDVFKNTKSNLLEKIASDILTAIFNEFPELEKTKVKIKKINPPMGGQIGAVGVEIMRER
ncbi:MAG: dihydroneopterin aldolase [Bacteroidales bacterium]|nr:dihydroneopterin aldolase [Bacteroidales bacterium]